MLSPYLLFLGDVTELAAAKTAAGILQWRPELCVAWIESSITCRSFGQCEPHRLRLAECRQAIGAPVWLVGFLRAPRKS